LFCFHFSAGAGAGPSGVKNFEHNHYGEMGFTEAGATVYCPPQPFIAYLPPPFSKPHVSFFCLIFIFRDFLVFMHYYIIKQNCEEEDL
jgi:hypothetical protein